MAKPFRNARNYVQFSGMAIEMGLIIFVGAWLGRRLDQWLALEKPIFTLLLTLFFTVGAMYRVIKNLER